MNRRAWGLAGSAALHVAAGWIWLSAPAPKATASNTSSTLVSIRLPAMASKPAPVTAAKALALPARLSRPAAPPALAAPAVVLAAVPIEASALAAPVLAAPVLAAPALPPMQTAAPAAVEPEYRAATPPDRACTERNVTRLYPPLLRERGIEGQVLLRVRVDERGQAAEVVVQGGSGWRLLDEAARLLTQGCRFMPARRGEQTLASWVEYPVRFALSGAVNQ